MAKSIGDEDVTAWRLACSVDAGKRPETCAPNSIASSIRNRV